MSYKFTLGPNDESHFGNDSTGTIIAERKPEIRTPSLFKVLLHNDDFTPMEFVVLILETYFSKDRTAAADIMLAVHHTGVGVCGVFPYEIAETKVSLVMEYARENEHPLQCSMEKV